MAWIHFPYINVHSVKIKIICCIMHLSFKRTTPNILFFHSYIQFILYFLHSHRLNFKIFCSYFFCLHIKSILKCLSSYSFMVFFIALFSSSKNKKKRKLAVSSFLEMSKIYNTKFCDIIFLSLQKHSLVFFLLLSPWAEQSNTKSPQTEVLFEQIPFILMHGTYIKRNTQPAIQVEGIICRGGCLWLLYGLKISGSWKKSYLLLVI